MMMTINPDRALFDESIEIIISDLIPHQKITIEASCQEANNHQWTSQAVFKADERGEVNVKTHTSLSGSYLGIDSMGLFWSMKPVEKNVYFFSLTDQAIEMMITASYQDIKCQKTIIRHPVAEQVEKRQINTEGVIGALFYSKTMLKGPALIVVSGSEGGISKTLSQLVASHGYVVLALGYFGLEGLPKKLENIPLEYFQNALKWLKKQPQVNENRIGLIGASRGGELALLLGSLIPEELKAIVAYVPSSTVYGGFPEQSQPAWVSKNRSIPFVTGYPHTHEEIQKAIKEEKIPFHAGTQEDPFVITDLFMWDISQHPASIEAAAIAVENIRCPILLFSGEEDKIWPSTLYGQFIMERLARKGSMIKRKHLHYPHAGHGFRFPFIPSADRIYHPIGQFWCRLGGTPKGNADANLHAWKEMLKFLKNI